MRVDSLRDAVSAGRARDDVELSGEGVAQAVFFRPHHLGHILGAEIIH